MVVLLSVIGLGLALPLGGKVLAGLGAQDLGSGSASYPIRFALPQPGVPIDTPHGPDSGVSRPAPSDTELGALAVPANGAVEKKIEGSNAEGPTITEFALPIHFDLRGNQAGGSQAGGSEAIAIRKSFVNNGVGLGSAELWVDPNGSIAVSTSDLVRLLQTTDRDLAESLATSGQERTSFSSLRKRGVSISYDPIADQVMMKTRS